MCQCRGKERDYDRAKGTLAALKRPIVRFEPSADVFH